MDILLVRPRKQFSRQKLELLPQKAKIEPEVIDISKLSESEISIVGVRPKYESQVSKLEISGEEYRMRLALFKQREIIREPKASLRTRAILLPESKVMGVQAVSPISKQISRQITYQRPIQAAKAVPSMKSISIQTPVQKAIQIQKTESVRVQELKTLSTTRPRMELPITLKPKPPKTSSDLFRFGKAGRNGRRGGFKFPELTRVTTPREIMKGFKI